MRQENLGSQKRKKDLAGKLGPNRKILIYGIFVLLFHPISGNFSVLDNNFPVLGNLFRFGFSVQRCGMSSDYKHHFPVWKTLIFCWNINFPVLGILFPVGEYLFRFWLPIACFFRFRKEIFQFRLVLARNGEGGPGALNTYLTPSMLNSAPYIYIVLWYNTHGCILYRECTHPLSCNYCDCSSCNWIVSNCNSSHPVATGSVRVATKSVRVATDLCPVSISFV